MNVLSGYMSVHRGHALSPWRPELEVQTVMSYHMGAGHQTLVLRKSCQSSEPLRHSSSPRIFLFQMSSCLSCTVAILTTSRFPSAAQRHLVSPLRTGATSYFFGRSQTHTMPGIKKTKKTLIDTHETSSIFLFLWPFHQAVAEVIWYTEKQKHIERGQAGYWERETKRKRESRDEMEVRNPSTSLKSTRHGFEAKKHWAVLMWYQADEWKKLP